MVLAKLILRNWHEEDLDVDFIICVTHINFIYAGFMVIGRNQAKLDAIKNELGWFNVLKIADYKLKTRKFTEDRYPHSTIKTYMFDFNSGEFEALRNELSAMDIGLASKKNKLIL